MTFLLDTNAISDLVREHRQELARFDAVRSPDRVLTCTVVRGEVLHGIGRLPAGKRKQALVAKVADLFRVMPCAALPSPVGDRYATIKLTQRAKGLPVDENDLWIAATALELGATLVTRDKDFSRIEGLQVVDWTA